jgi:hypothetical protein
LYNRKERTNLRKKGETKAVIEIKNTLVDLTISFYVTAYCLKLIRTENQERQTKTSVKCAIKKAIIRETVSCLSKSDLIMLKRKIIVKPHKQRKQAT